MDQYQVFFNISVIIARSRLTGNIPVLSEMFQINVRNGSNSSILSFINVVGIRSREHDFEGDFDIILFTSCVEDQFEKVVKVVCLIPIDGLIGAVGR